MATQPVQADHMGSKYDAYAQTATLKHAACCIFLHLVEALEGKRVLDPASGLGVYSRQRK